MDITGWPLYYKIDPILKGPCKQSYHYTPYISPNGSMLCMSWNVNDPYQDQPLVNYTQADADIYFNRELEYLYRVEGNDWAPELVEVDTENKRIFIKWYQETCNDIINDGKNRSLNSTCPEWDIQLEKIVRDLMGMGIYKLALSPASMYIDNRGLLRTFEFYACVDVANAKMERRSVNSIIAPTAEFRYNRVTADGIIDFEQFFKNMLNYTKWPIDVLGSIAKTL